MKRLAALVLAAFAATQADGQGSAAACWLGASFTTCFKPVIHTSVEGPASTTVSGYLASADWAAFNSGLAGAVPSSRIIATTAPLAGGGNLTADRTLSIPAATVSANGYLTSADWGAFNGGGRVAATVSNNGYLASADWATFNSRQAAGSYVPTSRTISTTSPITGGGDLSADRTFAIPAATVSANGYLTSADWGAFNGGGRVAATVSNNGYLASADWATFNSRVATTRSISTTAPITGGGDLSANRTFAIAKANGTTDGYLASTDWTTFNSKGGALSAVVARASAQALASTTIKNLGSLTLANAGTYLLVGRAAIDGTSTSCTLFEASFDEAANNTLSNTSSTYVSTGVIAANINTADLSIATGPTVVTIGGSTTYNLNVRATFTGTVNSYGSLYAVFLHP